MVSLLSGKTAVITGGASGNGREIALTFARHGANVVIADIKKRPREGGEPTHVKINAETNRNANFVSCDVTDGNDITAALDVAEEYGGVDIMVNNAGILKTGGLATLTESDFDSVMNVNVKGVFLGCKLAEERMRTQGGGNIINISSTAAMIGIAGNSVYCASKAAVKLFTYALAAELGPNIRVNAIHPGAVETQMIKKDVEIVGTDHGEKQKEEIPLRQFGQPTDVANTATYLASDLSSYVTGESIVLDGGARHATGDSHMNN